MTREEAIKVLEKQFDKSCGNYRYQNAEKLDFEDALRMAISALQQQERFGEVNKALTLDELSERNAPVFCQSKIFRMVGIGVCAKTDTSFLQVDTDLWQKRDQTGCFTARSRRRGRYEQETS